ncbi:MAG TPA: flagellar hook-associated protein FlgK [Sphingomonas sp.]|nr:flagellar hook-associated protein FlgK [Sphingomonas sp.]
MTDMIGIGVSGVRAYQTALSAIANNVSNADTPGYTRRTVTLEEAKTADSSQLLYTNHNEFGGVAATGIVRAWDDYKAAAARDASSASGSADARATWLANAENAMNDDATGVGQSATAFFGAGSSLASDPGNTGGRQALLQSLDQTAAAFRTTAGALAKVTEGITAQAQTKVDQVNAALAALDQVNQALRTQQPGTSSQAQLLDQRDAIIDSIAANVNVGVSLAGDGSATLRLSDGTALSGGVGMTGGARLAVVSSGDGRLTIQAIGNGKATTITAPGGALGGLAASSALVADQRAALDRLAANFAQAVNAWQAAGVDANGAAGQPLLSGNSAASLTLATSDTVAIAAGKAGGAANANLLDLPSLRGANGVEQGWATMVTRQGQLVSGAKAESSAASAQKDATASSLAAVTGVDLDNEAAQLLRYQQAYNASAKVIQASKDTMQSILDLF